MKKILYPILLILLASCSSVGSKDRTTVYQNEAVSIHLKKDQGALVIDQYFIRALKVEDSFPGDSSCERVKSPEKNIYIECKRTHGELYPKEKMEIIIFD